MKREREVSFGGLVGSFGAVSNRERQQADLFFADLLGIRKPRRAMPVNASLGATHRPFAEAAEARGPAETVGGDSGERFVHITHLLTHASRQFPLTGDNCVLRWARIPSGFSGAVDVVVHFHGFKTHSQMSLQRKASASGLELLTPGVARPTLGIVPHGHAVNGSPDAFTFPAIQSLSQLERFVEQCFTQFKNIINSQAQTLRVARMILTGHSGGGAALNSLMNSVVHIDRLAQRQYAGAVSNHNVHGFHYFDATYSGNFEGCDKWLRFALHRDAAALRRLPDQAAWARYMREQGASFRALYIAGSQTAGQALIADGTVALRLRELGLDPARTAFLRRYYRAQRVLDPNRVDHPRVALTYGGRLLSDAGDDLSADARDANAPPRRGRSACPPLTGVGVPLVSEDVPAPAASPSRALTQSEIDRLALITFSNTADIDAFFSRRGAAGFIDWFNTNLGGRAPFVRSGGSALRMGTSSALRQRFTAFWNNLAVAYDRPRITCLDFAALMCIVLNETSGDFSGHPERCGRGRTDAAGHRHAGLAYAFDAIRGVKASYNTHSGNRRAGSLFNDQDYIRAHGSLAPANRLANHGDDFGGAWNSDTYPVNDFPTDEDLSTTGFIMQADFYKFRGRGVIQTTSRRAYLPCVNYVQNYTGSNSVLNGYKLRWAGMQPDVVATVSTDDDWNRIFAQQDMLSRGLRLHSSNGNSDYRTMSTQESVLHNVPAPLPHGVPRGMKGSIYFMGLRISGSYRYAAGVYRDRVLALLQGMLTL